MSKRESDKSADTSRKVNVEIAPGNRTRLLSYLSDFNKDPDRRHPSRTLTDVLNAALDEFLTEELPRLPPLPAVPEQKKEK